MTRDGAALAIDATQLIASMFALIPVPIAITDGDGRVIAANSSFGDHFREAPLASSAMTTWEVEVPSGVFRMQSLPLNERGFRILYAEDIQDQVHLRRQVAHMERMAAIGRMVAGVATELSGSLGEIRTFRPLMARLEMESRARHALDTVFAEAQRAEGIVDALARLSQRTAPKRVPFNLNRIVRDAAASRGYGNGTRMAEISIELEASLPNALGDPEQIEEVILSLFVNAENAMTSSQGRPATIGVRTASRADRVQLHVMDSGFLRDVSRAFDASSRGVGLALCLEIVKDHGGELFAWSSYGNRTTFTLELPAVDVSADSTKLPEMNLGVDLRGKSLLVVDDDVHVTELVYDVLTRCGAEVSVSHSGETAKEKFFGRTYDAVVCDRRLPGMDGESFLNFVSAHSPALAGRLLLITGEAPDAIKDRAKNAKVLHKPFRVAELVESVRELFSEDRRQGF